MDSEADLKIDLILGNFPTPYFPITLTVSATMTKVVHVADEVESTEESDDEIRVSRSLYENSIVLGYINLEKLSMKSTTKKTATPEVAVTPATVTIEHPHRNLQLVHGGLELKLANVIPQKYGMVTVSMAITAIAPASDVKNTFKQIITDCDEMIREEMTNMASKLGGVTPFTAAEEQAAIAQAAKAESTTT